MEFFLEKYRLGQYRDLLGEVSPEEYSSIVDDINLTQETYQYAKMLRHAQSDPTQLARIESIILGRADVDQIRKLSKLNEGDIQKLRERALLESDGLVRRYNKPNLDPKEKQRLAILISKKQAEINFYSKDAYISFGAMDKTITSPKELKGALLSQLEMIHAKIDSYKGIGEASMGYEIYKYISRYTLALEAAGIKISPKMKLFQELSIGIQTADLGNRKMYDVYAQNRELKHRALVMDTFLDEAHQILALQDWNQIDIANIKAVIESLQVSVGDSVTDVDSTIESTPNSHHLSSETKLPTWDDDKTPPMGTKIPKEETPTWDDDKTPPMGTKTPKEETPTWDDDKTPPMGTKIPKEETPTWDDDKTPPMGTKTPKDGDRLITSNQENVYHVQDSSEQRFQADARIDDEGVLTITMRTELEDGTRSKLLKGKEQYDKILQYFGDRIKKIKGSWQYGSNLQKFLEIKSEGKSDEEAALGTWSGQQADKNGFKKAEVSIQKDSNGKIIKIEVYFYK
ncbi:MAG: hypothetical protein IPL95_12165 [Saprospiraceae bacterium]|nr:hypothetical protein [Saprospiraceae bacterium]